MECAALCEAAGFPSPNSFPARLDRPAHWACPPVGTPFKGAMSRGLDIERDDPRQPTSLRDHRKEERFRPVEKPLPKEVEVWRLDRDAIPVDRELPDHDVRDAVSVRGSEYRLRESEVDTLQDIGRFRVVDEADLQRFGYADNSTRMREDIRSLRDQGLVERRRIAVGDGDYVSP